MRPSVLAVFTCLLAFASRAGAAADLPQTPDCALSVAERVTVSAVIDGASFDLADGRRVRLAAIQAPMLSLGRSNVEDWPLAAGAKERLSKLVLNRAVDLAFDERGTDRHGDVLAHVFLVEPGGWLQARLVAEGFARVHTQPDARKCAQALLAREREARAAKRGIWALPYYRIREPDELDGAIGTFQIVEGVPLGVVERRDRIYLNFGRDYRSDFTATISSRDMKRFKSAGIDPLAWGDKTIRLRGWISLLNGPEIELTHPEQIELMDEAP